MTHSIKDSIAIYYSLENIKLDGDVCRVDGYWSVYYRIQKKHNNPITHETKESVVKQAQIFNDEKYSIRIGNRFLRLKIDTERLK